MGNKKFFRLTNWYSESREVVSWFHWLDRRGVPVALVRWERSAGTLYSVWRGGTDRLAGDKSEPSERWREEYEIVTDGNGFKSLVPERAGT